MTANNSHAQVVAADSHEPKAHAASHESGGSDEIDVTGLTGATGGGVVVTKRTGGHASDWATGGTTTYTPSSSGQKIQVGATASKTVGSGGTAVTFPEAFTNTPIVAGSVEALTVDGTGMNVQIGSITNTGFTWFLGGVSTATGMLRWIAIGI